jgi:uncharacterized protein (TIGR03435 family)
MDFVAARNCKFSILLLAGLYLFIGAARSGGQTGGSAQTSPAPNGAAPAAIPAFEVATIKPGSDTGRVMVMFTQDGLSISGVPMQMILREAFRTEDDHVFGAPSWVKSTRYDIEAKVSAEDAPKLKGIKREQRMEMLLSLLVERFNLKYHHETRELTTYSLVVAKGGVRMKESAPSDPGPKDAPKDAGAKDAPKEISADSPKAPPKGGMLRMMGPGHIESEGTPTQFLAHLLSQQLGKTVVDKTGLTERYDYTLQWTPDDATPMAGDAGGGPGHDENAPQAGGPSLFTAIEEQLGLKIESTKGPVDVIVIDHLDSPSAN